MGMDPLAMAQAGVAAGAVTQIVARSSKFSLFDSSKEVRSCFLLVGITLLAAVYISLQSFCLMVNHSA